MEIALIVFGYMTIGFVASLFLKRNDIADIMWGIGFLIIAIYTFVQGSQYIVSYIVTGCVLVWSLRLSLHIYSRNKNKTEDYRYKAWREAWGKWFYIRSYLQVFLLQGLLMGLISFPVIAANTYAQDFAGFHMVGVIVFLVGLFFEAVGDQQLKKFIGNPENKGRIIQTGLWQYTRHPNYFGEVTLWWGVWIMSLGTPFGIWMIVGPLTITILILGVSGVPMLERKMRENPDFDEYRKRVSVFFPLPPRKSA